jgi:hypothetical protein
MKKGDGILNYKIFLLLVSSVLIFVVGVSLISANSAGISINGPKTIVEGKVFYAETEEPVPGANVIVRCEDNNNIRRDKTKTGATNSEGFYYAIFDQQFECDNNDFVTVSATKNEETGENEGVVEGRVLEELNVALGSPLPNVPEFGLIVGITTVLGALGIFFLVRKK